ncbi:MAG: hypothetical protein MI922_22955, partial [Bacteroidales bacterium]|nr:hypothetical protein [Bacteroidales bacterium]
MQNLTTIYNELCQLFDLNGNNVEIVEKQINTETHTEYMEYSKNHENSCSEKEIINRKDKIFDSNLSKGEKKKLLKQLASINNIEAFRTIEKYLNQPNIQLYDWA